MPEFSRYVLEQLRQPLEEGSVTLVAAMNPCQCGFYGDTTRECRCTGAIIQRYLGKISGPLLDRIDLHIEVPAVPYNELRSNEAVTTSEQMKERVLKAREVQSARGFNNSIAPPGELRKLAALDDAGERTLEMAIRKLGLSARAHDRILTQKRQLHDSINWIPQASGDMGGWHKLQNYP